MAATKTARERLIARIEKHTCWTSTDGGNSLEKHSIKDGACRWCDLSIDGLAWRTGEES